MKINKNRLKEILLEEIAAVAEAAGHRGNPNKPWDAFFPPSAPKGDAPMMPPKPVAPSAEDLELAVQRVDELLNSGELSSGGWIEKSLRDIRSILTKSSAGAIEEGELAERSASAQERCKEKGGFWDLRKGVCYKDADRTKAFNENKKKSKVEKAREDCVKAGKQWHPKIVSQRVIDPKTGREVSGITQACKDKE
jgi:hypothetical protein